MEPETTYLFENRHVHNWQYVCQLHRHTANRKIPYTLIWCVMALVCAGLSVIHFRTDSWVYGTFCVLLLLFCLFQGLLLGQIRLRRSFNKSLAAHGRRAWESVARFGDTLEIQDGNGFGFQSEWSFCQRVEDRGEWLTLCFTGKLPKVYLRKADFTMGSAEEFLEWLAREHPEVRQA